jgi:DNA-binding GntR family transcriptional regulator
MSIAILKNKSETDPVRASDAAGRDRSSMADRATHRLRDRILDLTFAPGMTLDEKFLHDTLQVGRTPMREALNRLMSEGLIETAGGRGFVVARMDFNDAAQLLDGYVMCERMVATLVDFETAGLVQSLDAVNRDLRQFSKDGDILKVTAGNADFHRLLAQSTGNMHVAEFSSRLHNLARRLSHYIYRAEVRKNGHPAPLSQRPLDDHAKIISAIDDRDRNALIELVSKHGTLFRSRLGKVIEGDGRTDISFKLD